MLQIRAQRKSRTLVFHFHNYLLAWPCSPLPASLALLSTTCQPGLALHYLPAWPCSPLPASLALLSTTCQPGLALHYLPAWPCSPLPASLALFSTTCQPGLVLHSHAKCSVQVHIPAGVTPEKFGVAPIVGVPTLGVFSRGVCPPIRWLEGVSSQRDFLRLPPCGVGVSVTDSLWGVSAHPVWLGVSPGGWQGDKNIMKILSQIL